MLAFLLDALTYNVLFNFSSEFSKIIMLCVHRHYSLHIILLPALYCQYLLIFSWPLKYDFPDNSSGEW
jgi:hypothetical protein